VLIEHDLGLVWQIADRITVLDAGDVIASGLPREILSRSTGAQPVRRLAPKVADA